MVASCHQMLHACSPPSGSVGLEKTQQCSLGETTKPTWEQQLQGLSIALETCSCSIGLRLRFTWRVISPLSLCMHGAAHQGHITCCPVSGYWGGTELLGGGVAGGVVRGLVHYVPGTGPGGKREPISSKAQEWQRPPNAKASCVNSCAGNGNHLRVLHVTYTCGNTQMETECPICSSTSHPRLLAPWETFLQCAVMAPPWSICSPAGLQLSCWQVLYKSVDVTWHWWSVHACQLE